MNQKSSLKQQHGNFYAPLYFFGEKKKKLHPERRNKNKETPRVYALTSAKFENCNCNLRAFHRPTK
jgi:hypothetical protein